MHMQTHTDIGIYCIYTRYTGKHTLTFKLGCHGAVSGCYNVTIFIKPLPLSQFTNHWQYTTILYVLLCVTLCVSVFLCACACACACMRACIVCLSAFYDSGLGRYVKLKEGAMGSQMVTVMHYLWDTIALVTDCGYICACCHVKILIPWGILISREKTLQLI